MPNAKIKRILVPVEGSATDSESLELAQTLGKREHAEILALYVIEVRRQLAIDADLGNEVERCERVLAQVENHAKKIGLRIQTDLLQAREAGSAIVSEAVERNIDLIVMGVPYLEKFGTFAVEARAQYVLDHAECRVILTRESLKRPEPIPLPR